MLSANGLVYILSAQPIKMATTANKDKNLYFTTLTQQKTKIENFGNLPTDP